MVTIDLANKRLMKIYTTELSDTETKILSLLSDNKFYKISEIAKYIHYTDSDTYKKVIQLMKKYDFLIDFEKHRGKGYRVKSRILIK